MTMIIDGTNGLTFNNATTQASAGCILQVVQATYSTVASTTSTTPQATGLTATITPKFSTSKILIIASVQGVQKENGNVASSVFLNLFKNGSNLINYAQYVGYTNTSSIIIVGGNTTNYLDSPATTSATTYAVYFRSAVSGQNVFVQADSDVSTITLMEIAG
jgi:hypothetical protein